MINRKAACCQRLLMEQSQHRQCDGARYKICCEKHNLWTCQTKIYAAASPLKRILWNKGSDSNSTGFVFESICAKLVLDDFWCNQCLFNVFRCLSDFILCLFNTILCIFNAILWNFNVIFCLFNAILCLFVAKPDFGEKLLTKLSKADISAIFKLSGKLSLSI